MDLQPISKCQACRDGSALPFAFSMAFQPIVDVESETVYAYEALVRGAQGQSAAEVLAQVGSEQLYAFDQSCRVKAITLAAQLGLMTSGAKLSINFLPRAVYSPAACIQLTLRTARAVGVPVDRLIFEVIEREEVVDRAHLRSIAQEYQRQGLSIALDDFGAGFSGLNLLAEIHADIIKLDMALVRDVNERPVANAIVRHMVSLARTLGTKLIAEGVETLAEYRSLRECGVTLMQGWLFARPAFEAFPEVHLSAGEWSTLRTASASRLKLQEVAA